MNITDPIFIIIALLLVSYTVAGFYFLLKTRTFVKNSSKARVSISGVEIEGKGKNARQKVSIKFRDQYGKEIFSHIYTALKPYKEGDSIDILYLKADSQKIKIDNWLSLYGVSAGLFSLVILVPVALMPVLLK
jgi:hypothetical protein